jgi:hypothetical protein
MLLVEIGAGHVGGVGELGLPRGVAKNRPSVEERAD